MDCWCGLRGVLVAVSARACVCACGGVAGCSCLCCGGVAGCTCACLCECFVRELVWSVRFVQ